MHIERIGTTRDSLGEGPLWDVDTQRLYWVDSLEGRLWRLTGDQLEQWDLPTMVGSLAIADDEVAIVALQNGLHRIDLTSGGLSLIVDPEPGNEDTRFNDGKVDRAGHFLAGTMGIKIRDRALGSLYRLRKSGELEVLEDDVVVSNGPCFSPDGGTLYFNDGRRRILAYDYDPDGPLTNKREFFVGADHDTGSDGATVDADGNVWVALIGSGEVGCLNPGGRFIERFAMPVPLPSSVMFGGPNLDELYVTSISNSGNRTSDAPEAGALFRVTGLGANGIAEPRYGQ